MPYRDLDPTPAEKITSPNAPESEVEAPQHRMSPGNLWAGLGSPPADAGSTLRKSTNGRLSRAGSALLHMQNQYGNQYVQRVINPQQRLTVQPKLMLGDVDTPSEQEADQFSSAISGGRSLNAAPTPVNGPVMPVSPQTENAINQARGGGQPLPESTQAQMSQTLGTDLSGVRVHTDSRANSLNQSLQAKAFTTGQDIFFRRGAYSPGSSGGQQLLAHELTHVAQQTGGPTISNGPIIQRLPIQVRYTDKAHQYVDLTIQDSELNNDDFFQDKDPHYLYALYKQLERIMSESLQDNKGAAETPTFEKIKGYSEKVAKKLFDQDEWQPIRMGVDLYAKDVSPKPNEEITERYVPNENIHIYITPQRQVEIMSMMTRALAASGPLKPAYWVQDRFSSHYKEKLRPVITPESFPEGLGSDLAKTGSPKGIVYRGTSLSPIQLVAMGGDRAWGTDMDLYLHTNTLQTNRRHSGYLSTTSSNVKALQFSTDYIYKIDISNLFRIDAHRISPFPDEEEISIPYHIPLENYISVSVTTMGSGDWSEIPFRKRGKKGSGQKFEKVAQWISETENQAAAEETTPAKSEPTVLEQSELIQILLTDEKAVSEKWADAFIQGKPSKVVSVKKLLKEKGFEHVRLNGELVKLDVMKEFKSKMMSMDWQSLLSKKQ